jgi:2-polyprenyl-3-methyl-5-hydroxy-6-metoxy-1,4-benzoquinol methylase
MHKKIKLNLLDLKSKEDLIGVYEYFKKSTSNWFDEEGSPKKEFFEIRGCPLCNSKGSELLYKVDHFCYHECLNCSSIYTKPHPKEDILNSLYSNGEYQIYQDKLVKKGKKIRKGVLEARKYQQLKTLVKKNDISILDVGCGNATFLDICKTNKWQVEGVDPTVNSSIEIYKKYGIKVHEGNFNNINFSKKFDIITFWGVLEHLSNPIDAIKKAKKYLKNDGIIAFEVPSSDCFLRYYLERYEFGATRYIESGRHNIFFSKKIIHKIANNFGLTVKLFESNGLDVQTILLDEFNQDITEKIINMQDIINDLMLGDHYRVFLSFNK